MELFMFGSKLFLGFIVIYSLVDRICKCVEVCSLNKNAAVVMKKGEKIEKTEEK